MTPLEHALLTCSFLWGLLATVRSVMLARRVAWLESVVVLNANRLAGARRVLVRAGLHDERQPLDEAP